MAALFALETHLGASWPHIHACHDRTNAIHAQLEQAVASESREDSSTVVFGSIARRELTANSDVDWSYLVDGQADAKHQEAAVRVSTAIESAELNDPGREGVFGKLVFSHNLVQYIGGEADTNANLTRRVLLLLESKAIGRPDAYTRVLRAVLERYLTNDHGWMKGKNPYRVPRFLHNDIARYWRTVTVDFAYKQWSRDNKGWALRSAKLRMSRKLTYAAGLLYCFGLSDQLWDEGKNIAPGPERRLAALDKLASQSDRTPLDLLAEAFASTSLRAQARSCIDAYDGFLAILSDAAKRDHLDGLSSEAADDDPVYTEVRALGKAFEGSLTDLFIRRIDPDNRLPDLTEVYGVF